METDMRIAIIDRHPAMRAGIEAILERSPGVEVVAAAGGDLHEIGHALYRTAPDVVMVEDTPGRLDGVELARELKALGPGPKVLLHGDRPDAVQVASAMLADADGVIDTAAQPREILEALRAVADGRQAFPELGGRELRELARRLPAEDHAILAMRLAATPRREIADTLRMDARALRRRVAAMIARLRTGAAATLSAGAAPSAAG
jgi:two-component system invasion response regulator UvrY